MKKQSCEDANAIYEFIRSRRENFQVSSSSFVVIVAADAIDYQTDDKFLENDNNLSQHEWENDVFNLLRIP